MEDSVCPANVTRPDVGVDHGSSVFRRPAGPISARVSAGHLYRAADRRFGVNPSCAIKLMQHVAKTGTAKPQRQGRPSGAGKLAEYAALPIRWVEATPDITMPDFARRLATETKVATHPASLSRVLVAVASDI